MPLLDYRARMLPMTFTAPSGATFFLQYDRLDREGGKKLATNEVLDSDISITQDQGNQAVRYPIDVYFTGDDYDLSADGFFSALSERYSISNSGTLNHPRWGLIDVIPSKWKQSESFVSGQRRANFSVDFIRVYPSGGIFESITKSISQVLTITQAIKLIATGDLISDVAQAVSSVGSVFSKSINTISNAISGQISDKPDLTSIINNIEIEFQNLNSDPVENSDLIFSQMYRIIDIPTTIEDDTFSKINSFSEIIDGLINDSNNSNDLSDDVKKNKAILGERLVGYSVASQCVSALYTNFKTRSDAIVAIEILNDSYVKFANFIETIKVESDYLIKTYSGNSELMESVYDVYTRSISIILENSFNLSTEIRIVLTEKSDPVTLCYEYYKSISNDTLDMFFDSNSIVNTEFIELQPGREVVFYVN